MNKKMIKNIIIGVILLGLILGYYFYLSGKDVKDAGSEVVETTLTQDVLAKDLEKSYPATPKEVVKYYNEIQECYYNEENDEKTIREVMVKSRELFDVDLLAKNSEEQQFEDLMKEVEDYKEKERDIFGWSTDSADDVVYNTFEGSDWATIKSYYTLRTKGAHSKTTQIFLLRKDAEAKWKIYGWDLSKPEETGEQ